MITNDKISPDIIGYQGMPSGNANEVIIQVSKKDGAVLNGTFSFYDLKTLKSLPVFHQTEPEEVELLVSHWQTKIAPGVIIKICD
ncbi:hypothetical protein [Legionella worsleiensis]|uniref:Uncharacterized protein n=1 Tax=Legionella worsleiensis TaxID=45076 RepID=A0A0W1A6D7_9GAMM|nr:hypothetical protein [Legionella worsleiensis]KTD76868.1 hypothetical protein Lwor_2093 [Legionella worsleiensis]STY33462.1 Uncharacterised protein [Legionella worsleiensis]